MLSEKYVASQRCPLFLLYYSLRRASVRGTVKLCELLSVTLVREHTLLASEASIWSRLMASNAVNYHSHPAAMSSSRLRIRVVICHELPWQLSLVPVNCYPELHDDLTDTAPARVT